MALAVHLDAADELSLGRNLLTLAILTLSVWVGTCGCVFDVAGLDRCYENDYALEFLTWYTPELSALWHPFVQMKPLSDTEVLTLAVFGAAWLYLAIPLLATCWRQAVTGFADWREQWTAIGRWRF